MKANNSSTRYHALDGLRASMMLLGVWLHTVVGYSRDGGWPYKDAYPTALYDWTLGLIHTFRMPVFYVMAGFFGALLIARRGDRGFLENRLKRVLAPLVCGWLAVYPLVIFLAGYVHEWNRPGAVGRVVEYLIGGGIFQHLHPMHFWFLEYLVILYTLAFMVVKLVERLPSRWLAAANSGFRWALGNSWRPVLFAIPSFLVLMLMRGAYLEDPPGFLPVPRIVLAYTVPFSFGWLLYLNRDLLPTFDRHAWKQVGIAALLIAGYMLFIAPLHGQRDLWHIIKPVRAASGALLLWLITFGLTGVFLRYLSAERPLARYLSDGSYWMYLAHMPVVMAFQMLLASVAWPTEVKVWVCLLLSIPVLVLSYDLMVRATWIGVFLNGRRYERRFMLTRKREMPAPAARTVTESV